MKKFDREFEQNEQTLEIQKVEIEALDDETLVSVTGGCGGMPFTCRCTESGLV